jgi:hypothetical protein
MARMPYKALEENFMANAPAQGAGKPWLDPF